MGHVAHAGRQPDRRRDQGIRAALEINGVGYRAAVQGKNLQLALGYSHDVVYPIPEGIAIATPKPTEIVITGIDKQKVGQVAAEIREYPAAGAVQGQGREIRRRVHLPQGRQEEITEPPMAKHQRRTDRRRRRVRRQSRRRRTGAPRLSVFRSSKHIYAQVIDDAAAVRSPPPPRSRRTLREELQDRRRTSTRPRRSASCIAERAEQKGVKDVVFDRGGYLYHGRVKALADAAREGGLNF